MVDMGSCCVYENQENVVLSSLKNKKECNYLGGEWAGVDYDGDYHAIDSIRCQEILNVYENEGSISSSYVDDWKIGEYIFGGRYIGVFNVQSSSFGFGSVCLGNHQTGPVGEYVAQDNEKSKNSKTKYAVFISSRDLFSQKVFLDRLTIPSNVVRTSSFWDVEKNNDTWNNSVQRGLDITNTNYFKWTLPSLDVLSFAYHQTTTREFISNLHSDINTNHPYQIMNQDYYWTNTLYNKKIRGKVYSYIQNFSKNSKVGLREVSDKSLVRTFLVIPIK
jgi:hypothetical protein